MAERPFPPSPRRRGLARRAGLHAASPILVGGLAAAAVTFALAVLGRAAADRLGAAIAAACRGSATITPTGIVHEVLELVLPLLAIAGVVAIAVHLAQTRAPWSPRRKLDDAPSLPADAGARARRSALDLLGVYAIATAAFGWLWWAAPRLAALPSVPVAGAAMMIAALCALATTWVGLGAGDALLRTAQLGQAMQMTAREKREDERRSAADPRWRALRTKLARSDGSEIAGASVLVLGDDLAIAIAWDPVRRPVPTRIAIGRGVQATRLLALARRSAIAVHREPALARELAGAREPIPEPQWPRLAEIIAATRRG